MDFTRATKSQHRYYADADGFRFELTKARKGTTGYDEARPWNLRIGRLNGSFPTFVANERFESKAAAESFADSYTN